MLTRRPSTTDSFEEPLQACNVVSARLEGTRGSGGLLACAISAACVHSEQGLHICPKLACSTFAQNGIRCTAFFSDTWPSLYRARSDVATARHPCGVRREASGLQTGRTEERGGGHYSQLLQVSEVAERRWQRARELVGIQVPAQEGKGWRRVITPSNESICPSSDVVVARLPSAANPFTVRDRSLNCCRTPSGLDGRA